MWLIPGPLKKRKYSTEKNGSKEKTLQIFTKFLKCADVTKNFINTFVENVSN